MLAAQSSPILFVAREANINSRPTMLFDTGTAESVNENIYIWHWFTYDIVVVVVLFLIVFLLGLAALVYRRTIAGGENVQEIKRHGTSKTTTRKMCERKWQTYNF